MDLYTAEHKTSSAGLRREQFLPLVIPTEGIVAGDWIGTYIELCHQEGFDWHRVECRLDRSCQRQKLKVDGALDL